MYIYCFHFSETERERERGWFSKKFDLYSILNPEKTLRKSPNTRHAFPRLRKISLENM